jgi:predicted DNA repair protein MutK
MAFSSFAGFEKIAALLKNTSIAVSKGLAGCSDDLAAATGVGVSASIDDPAIKTKSFAGLMQDREIPAFKNVLKGAVKNRLIIIPAAVGINAIFPAALPYVLAFGGTYLAYEAGETVMHGVQAMMSKGKSGDHASESHEAAKPMTPDEYQAEVERELLSTDPVMVAEVTGLSMSVMKTHSILGQLGGLAASSTVISAAVFGAVLMMIRADNVAERFKAKEGAGRLARAQRWAGGKIMDVLPKAMTGISYVGTGVMFGIGGELINKCVPPLEHMSEHMTHHVSEALSASPAVAGLASGSLGLAFAAATGIVVGVSLATAHHYTAPFLDPKIEKAKNALAPAFNAISTLKNTVVETAAEFVPARFKSKAGAKPEEPKQP